MQPGCRLCRRARPLRDSHIFPEFLYRAVYDTSPRRFEEITFGQNSRVDYHQKGLREPLLCAECEQLLGSHERYASQLFFHRDDFHWVTVGATTFISPVKYSSFKLFLLSLLWRAGVSSLPSFREVTLGPHEPRIRAMLLASDPGKPHDYPATLFSFREHADMFRETIIPPYRVRIGSHQAYRTAFAGWLCTFFVSRHTAPSQAQNSVIRDDDVLPIRPISLELERHLVDVIGRRLATGFPADET